MLNRILFPEGNCVSNVGFSLIPRSSPAHKSNSMNSNKVCRAKKKIVVCCKLFHKRKLRTIFRECDLLRLPQQQSSNEACISFKRFALVLQANQAWKRNLHPSRTWDLL